MTEIQKTLHFSFLTLLCLISFSTLNVYAKELEYDISGASYNTISYSDDYKNLLYDEKETTRVSLSLRLIANIKASSNFYGRIHILEDYLLSSQDIDEPSKITKYRFFDLSDIQYEKSHFLKSSIDRLNFTYYADSFEITAGRQAISFGKSFFWNLLDIFAPYEPASIIRDYKLGVDAIRLDFPLSNFSGLNFIAAFQEDEDDENTLDLAFLSRFFTTIYGCDISLQGGKIYGGKHLGAAFVADIRGVEFRFESARFISDKDVITIDYFNSYLFGLSYYFANSLNVQAEYLYNGGGTEEKDAMTNLFNFAQKGVIPNISKKLCALSLSYDLLPILTTRASFIHSLSDFSYMSQYDLSYGITDNIDLVLLTQVYQGKAVNNGKIKSDFGSYPDIYALIVKVYF